MVRGPKPPKDADSIEIGKILKCYMIDSSPECSLKDDVQGLCDVRIDFGEMSAFVSIL